MLSLQHNAYKNSLISPSPLTQGRELKQVLEFLLFFLGVAPHAGA